MFLPISALSSVAARQFCPEFDGRILGLDWPAGGGKARRVVYRARELPTGLYPSWKMDRMIECESLPERHAYVLADAHAEIKRFREQPVVIRYVLNGEEREHVPDSLVEFPEVKEFWEVKPLKYAMDDDVLTRTRLMTAELPKLGYQYRLVLAEDVGDTARLAIARHLLKFGRANPDPLIREQIRVALTRLPFITWGAVADGAFGPSGRGAVCRMTLEGVLGCDAETSIDRFTQFYPRDLTH